MRLALIAMLVGSIALAGCALRAPSVTQDQAAGERAPAARQRGQPEVAATWRAYARKLPPGSRVTVTTTANRTVKGTLIEVEENAIVVKPRTRIPEPFQSIAFTELEALELDQGSGIGKTIAISASVAAGAVLGVLLILAAAVND